MRTMHPVVGLGSYRWDPEWLPLDEFEERLRVARREMASRGWSGLIVHGNSQDCAALTYLTNFFPRNRWAIALIPAQGPLKLLVAGSTRDLPAASLLTWVKDVASYGDAAKILPGWIGTTKPKLGVYGESFMRHGVHETIVGAARQHATLESADALLDGLMSRKRPRELSMIRKSCAILAKTVETLKREKAKGASVVAATVEAERVARASEAQDIRILFSLDGGKTLRPFEEISDVRCDPLVAYVAVRYLGYWSEAMVTLADKPHASRDAAAKALGALLAAAKPGATLSGAPPNPHPALGKSLGHAIGLSLDEGNAALQDGGVYSLHVGIADGAAGNALVSAMVAVKDGGNEILWRDA
jgi:Xaa-Pro aminopeptidase